MLNRKTIKILFPQEAAERQCTQESSPGYKSIVSKFESLNINHPRRNNNSNASQAQQRQRVDFSLSKFVFIVVSVIGIIMVSVCETNHSTLGKKIKSFDLGNPKLLLRKYQTSSSSFQLPLLPSPPPLLLLLHPFMSEINPIRC